MRSTLGHTFANFYMGNLEKMVLNELEQKPLIYCRYVDDILMLTKDSSEFKNLKSKLENCSVLKFTTELNINNKLSFMDVLIDNNSKDLQTSVYRKHTNIGICLNGKSDCIKQ